jgi:hypothetical protein
MRSSVESNKPPRSPYLAVATEATRRRLYDLVAEMVFEADNADDGPEPAGPGESGPPTAPPYDPDSAGLRVFHAFHRWFVTWRLPPEEAAGLPPEQRVQLKTVHDDPASEWGVVLHEV